jgi:hypothetical protein
LQSITLNLYLITMRTKITLVLLLSLITYAANAQFPPYYFGLKAAPQISWMRPNTDSYTSEGVKIGFAWGFIAEFNFTENHCIATGFNMQFNGGKLKFPAMQASNGDTLYGDMNRNYSLKYIEVPLTLKMRTNPIKNMRYFGRIGLGTAFKIGSKKTDDFTPTGGTTISSEKTNYEDVAFARESLIVGMGAEYEPKGGPKLGVELTFNNGFTNILTGKNSADPSVNEKATPNFFELAFSVLF